jgi:5-methylthioribose kinase
MINIGDIDILKQYMVDKGFAENLAGVYVEYLGGGVSNIVAGIKCDAGNFVMKQALAKLKVKAEWLSDVERAHVEKLVLEILPSIVPGKSPKLVFEDPANFLFMMESAPEGAVTWKQMLLHGECDTGIALQAGEFLGEVHAKTSSLANIASIFDERKYFHQLRIDPFFSYLVLAYPSMRSSINAHIEETWSRRECLVFGDYSPKNILVYQNSIIPIDFEVAHYGDPSFDIGFLWAHLVLKAVYLSDDRYLELLRQTWVGYQSKTGKSNVEARSIRQLGFLLLARMDGKSPVEYITSDIQKEKIRMIGKAIIQNKPCEISEVLDLIKEDVKNEN